VRHPYNPMRPELAAKHLRRSICAGLTFRRVLRSTTLVRRAERGGGARRAAYS